jgi:hypothetical protein
MQNVARVLLFSLCVGCWGPEGAPLDPADADASVGVASAALIVPCTLVVAPGTCAAGERLVELGVCYPVSPAVTWSITAEICDGAARDEDCDGYVDEGCPTRVGLGLTIIMPLVGGNGGTPFTWSNAGQVVTALNGSALRDPPRYLETAFTAFSPLSSSGPLQVAVGTQGPFRFTSRDGWFAYPPIPGLPPPTFFTTTFIFQCPPPLVGIGIDGRNGVYIDAITSLQCGRIVPVSDDLEVGTFRVVVVDSGAVTAAPFPAGGSFVGFSGGGGPFRLRCPPEHVMTGIHGRSGGHIDALGLRCTRLQMY